MLNPARRSGEEENAETRKALEKAGIEVKDSNPDFGITHEKSLVVDDETAFVKSLNWETKNLTVTRDYAIVTSHKHEVDEVIAGFEADWHREKFDPASTPISSGAAATAASGSPASSTTPNTLSSCKTSATRIPSSSSAWFAPRCAE